MKTSTMSAGGTNLTVIALGILAALLAFAFFTGRKLPLLANDRAALLAFVVIGMLMCAPGGIGRVSANGAWLHPFSIIGYLLGAAIITSGE